MGRFSESSGRRDSGDSAPRSHRTFEDHQSEGGGRGRGRSGGRDSGRSGGRSFGGRSGGRDSGRSGGRSFGGRGRGRSDRGEVEMTRVTCSECGVKCDIPFKPMTDKPVYCSECYEQKEGKSTRSGGSSKDLEMINRKLDKIMKALDVE